MFDRFVKNNNNLNSQIQGDSLNSIKTKSVISSFLGKMKFMKEDISRRNFFFNHSIALHDVFTIRFEDI